MFQQFIIWTLMWTSCVTSILQEYFAGLDSLPKSHEPSGLYWSGIFLKVSLKKKIKLYLQRMNFQIFLIDVCNFIWSKFCADIIWMPNWRISRHVLLPFCSGFSIVVWKELKLRKETQRKSWSNEDFLWMRQTMNQG